MFCLKGGMYLKIFQNLLPVHFKLIILAENLILVIILICMVRHMALHIRRTDSAGQRKEYYTSVQVNAGESLWEISRRYYSVEYKSMGSYMKKIMNLNHMSSSNINEGAYLIIPYYQEQPFTQPADSGSSGITPDIAATRMDICYSMSIFPPAPVTCTAFSRVMADQGDSKKPVSRILPYTALFRK